jgi:superfamily II DNA or RNA helicase
MRLRDYQRDAAQAIREAWSGGSRSTLCVMPTGTGKTEVFASLVDERSRYGRCLVVAASRELILQTAERIRRATYLQTGVEMGAYRPGPDCAIVVGSVQSLGARNRIQWYDPRDFSTVVVDEAHHACRSCKSYRTVLEHMRQNNELRVLGVTATPDRGDRRSLIGKGLLFDSLSFEYPLFHLDRASAIADGWLVPIRAKHVVIDDLDFSVLRESVGDYTAKSIGEMYDLERAKAEEGPLHGVANQLIKLANGRQTAVFCGSIAHAEAQSQVLDYYAKGKVSCVHGKRKDRKDQMDAYSSGAAQYIVSCDALIEGWDDPPTAVIALCRPTKSRARMAQMIGRGTRTLGGLVDGLPDRDARLAAIAGSEKPDLLVLDFVGSTADLKLVANVADIFGSIDDEDELLREYTRHLDEQRPQQPVHDLLTDAALLAEDERRLVAYVAATREWLRCTSAKATVHETDLFGECNDSPVSGTTPLRVRGTITDKQARLLVAMGVNAQKLYTWSSRQAGVVIDRYKAAGRRPDWQRYRDWDGFSERRVIL